jgi:formylglycine-generating enzyme required for sulfatase activity
MKHIFRPVSGRLLAFLLLLWLPDVLAAQTLFYVRNGCAVNDAEMGQNHYVFDPSDEAQRIIRTIMEANFLEPNFVIKSGDVENALATVEAGQRYIIYNTTYVERIKRSGGSDWPAFYVFAHEIGHHLSNHRFDLNDNAKSKEQELKADVFAGGMLYRLGATLDQAQIGIGNDFKEGGSNTHPPRRARLEAIASGWRRASEISPQPKPVEISPLPKDDPTPPPVSDAAERRRDLEAYDKAKASNTLEAYQEYLRRYPNGIFAANARKAVADIQYAKDAERRAEEDDLDWRIAQTADTEVAYQQYLNTWPEGRHRQEAENSLKALKAPATITDPIAGTFIWVKGGDVRLSDTYTASLSSFYIAQTEVTQAQWRAVMGTNPSNFKNCDDCPVESVSWLDVQDFISKLNSRSGGARYRLPTEAEWEYAARGGSKSRGFEYAGGSNIDEVAWYDGNSGSKTRPVKGKKPNELGLYDMSGNVWEWCSDWYGDYPNGKKSDPTGPSSGSYRVDRGGGWSNNAGVCRAAYRGNGTPAGRLTHIGFRLALQ